MEATSLDSLERDFQEVLAELVGDKSLERFRQEYEKLHRALKKSHESESAACTSTAVHVHDPGLVGCFFAITSILPSFSRFMVESSSGYSDRSIAKIPGRSTASLFTLLFPRPVMMVSVVEIDVSKYCRSLG